MASRSEPSDESVLIRIDTGLLIPGRGNPINNATCIISAATGKIEHVGPTSSLPTQYAEISPVEVTTLMPGLWDTHTHYYGARKVSIDEIYHTPAPLAGARTAYDLAATLNAGITSVRELGGWANSVAPAVNEGTIQGPNIYSAIVPISMSGGHGDAHGVPEPALKAAIEHTGLPLAICDGVPECIKVVRQQLRRGAACIKVLASGGCTSQLDDPEHRQFSDEELQAMVEEATRAGRAVAAHCHGKSSILAAVRAGARTIEHGTYLDEECVAAMKERDVMLVPTRTFFEAGLQVERLWSPESFAKLKKAAARHEQACRLALDGGIRFAMGTDLGMSGKVDDDVRVFAHGNNTRELLYMTQVGLGSSQAIEAATANAPETLGEEFCRTRGLKSGQLREGWDADLIAVKGDPLQHIEILAEPEKISHVWKGGRLFKAPTI